ncbi:MAG: hypothetical protein ACI8TX_001218 [Hyphomicrobiaceae bacterium]|jgi:hypothetical protein
MTNHTGLEAQPEAEPENAEPVPVAEVAEDFALICTLPRQELGARTQMLREDLLPLLVAAQRLDDRSGVALGFASEPQTQAKLEALVDFERSCCGSLQWELEAVPSNDRLRLTICGLSPDSSLYSLVSSAAAKIADEASRGQSSNSGNLVGLAKAGGVGVFAGLVLCCVVPLAMTALVGGSLAVAASQLDDPRIIAPVSLAIAAMVWRSWRRRERDCCS